MGKLGDHKKRLSATTSRFMN